jgi:hypothetical protein
MKQISTRTDRLLSGSYLRPSLTRAEMTDGLLNNVSSRDHARWMQIPVAHIAAVSSAAAAAFNRRNLKPHRQ